MSEPRELISCLGDRAVIVRLGDRADRGTFLRVFALTSRLEASRIPGVLEFTPAFTSITIHYDPMLRDVEQIRADLARAVAEARQTDAPVPRFINIPVCYGGECGIDLDYVAEYHQLTRDDVIRIHSSAEYLVHMLGFVPGFPYLGGLPLEIATPRHPAPRLQVPMGSVGIAGSQSGIYSFPTPGGWQIIGRTPRLLFQPMAAEPTLLRPGDIVRFEPISEATFHATREYSP